jgi:hypothetical protein
MPRYLIRKNCEYSLEVEADDVVKATEKAEAVASPSWNQAWSPYEAELLPEEPKSE